MNRYTVYRQAAPTPINGADYAANFVKLGEVEARTCIAALHLAAQTFNLPRRVLAVERSQS